tara:strand:- start:19197 stop:19886 length:690 start_codon:yes stop_codon:yes gene_type:complete
MIKFSVNFREYVIANRLKSQIAKKASISNKRIDSILDNPRLLNLEQIESIKEIEGIRDLIFDRTGKYIICVSVRYLASSDQELKRVKKTAQIYKDLMADRADVIYIENDEYGHDVQWHTFAYSFSHHKMPDTIKSTSMRGGITSSLMPPELALSQMGLMPEKFRQGWTNHINQDILGLKIEMMRQKEAKAETETILQTKLFRDNMNDHISEKLSEQDSSAAGQFNQLTQ